MAKTTNNRPFDYAKPSLTALWVGQQPNRTVFWCSQYLENHLAKRTATTSFAAIDLNPELSTPLYRQLYDKLRDAILTRQLMGGTRLPSTRVLAAELNISRNTVMTAFEQLLAEGYLTGKVGAGTYVAHVLPEDLLYANGYAAKIVTHTPTAKGRRLSERSTAFLNARLTTASNLEAPIPFRPGTPAYAEFPFEIWARLTQQQLQNPGPNLLGYAEPAGYQPLREAIAGYLWALRGVRCEAAQVIIVAGSQQALDLAARVLLDSGDTACIEDPGYLGARNALQSAGAHLWPVSVDNDGLDVASLNDVPPNTRLVYVSPSHQYPLGVTMSLARRLALLEWANQQGAWILEDDYDSEYRYSSRPLAALQGLDGEGRVIYIGTFSKVLFPALRLGYMVVPADLAPVFVAARAVTDRHSPTLEQAIVSDFIAEGHFARHIRKMRMLYAERQAVLVAAAQSELTGLLEVKPAQAGMHIVGWLPPHITDTAASQRAAALGVEVPALSAYALKPYPRGGLLLGYAGYNQAQIVAGISQLKAALQTFKYYNSS